jgi:hypothetical protein
VGHIGGRGSWGNPILAVLMQQLLVV